MHQVAVLVIFFRVAGTRPDTRPARAPCCRRRRPWPTDAVPASVARTHTHGRGRRWRWCCAGLLYATATACWFARWGRAVAVERWGHGAPRRCRRGAGAGPQRRSRVHLGVPLPPSGCYGKYGWTPAFHGKLWCDAWVWRGGGGTVPSLPVVEMDLPLFSLFDVDGRVGADHSTHRLRCSAAVLCCADGLLVLASRYRALGLVVSFLLDCRGWLRLCHVGN